MRTAKAFCKLIKNKNYYWCIITGAITVLLKENSNEQRWHLELQVNRENFILDTNRLYGTGKKGIGHLMLCLSKPR
jgi:hypothetical protein